MTPLRQRMLDARALRGIAPRTQESCVGAVGLLARYRKRPSDGPSAPQVQDSLLHLLRNRGRSVATVNQYGCAFRFFHGAVLESA